MFAFSHFVRARRSLQAGGITLRLRSRMDAPRSPGEDVGVGTRWKTCIALCYSNISVLHIANPDAPHRCCVKLIRWAEQQKSS
jgi:hypothetical protein